MENRNDQNAETKSASATVDVQQDIEINKNRKKVDIAIVISALALLISLIQLIITSPFFMDRYNKPTVVVEEGENLMTDVPVVSLNYQIKNNSNKTANNLILAIDAYDLKSISFYPANAFTLSDSVDGEYFFEKRYYFTKNILVPNEQISVSIFTPIDTLAHRIGTDTLKPFIAYNCQHLVPHIAELKTDLGYAKLNRPDKYIIRQIHLELKGHYKLEGIPIKQ